MAEKTLQEVLYAEGMEVQVEMVAVNSDEEAQRLRFVGSPTNRVDGEDLFPVPERASYALGCRTYITAEGLRGSPTPQMLIEALTKEGPPMPTAFFRDDVRRLVENGAQLVDVLPHEEYEEGRLPGAIDIPLKELDRETSGHLRRDAPVIVYCHDYQ